MKPILKSFVVLGLLLLFLPAEEVSAQVSNFVPCDGTDCSACDFVSMINVIIKWLFGMIFVLFAVIMTSAGFGLVTSGGNQSALDAAKGKFQNAIIGIIIVMAGWLIVDTIMRGTLDGGTGVIKNYGPWSEVQCQVQVVAQPWSRTGRDAVDSTVVTPPSTASQSSSHAEAVDSLGSGFVISSSGNCSDKTNKTCTSLDGMKDLTITRVKELQTAVGGTFIVTGGTEVGHAGGDYSHGNGYKIDLRPEAKLNSYIESNFTKLGGSKWKDSNGNIYYRHGPPDHWDLSITN